LDLEENCQGTCFEDAFLKAFQYATTDEKSTKAWNMCLSKLHKGICKNESLVFKTRKKENK
jgi:hypothetical protein